VLNDCFDALYDLAEFLSCHPIKLCFGRTLGLAFGARGHGKASAHYELQFRVINLTRNHGPGCLAHEWFHGLDHFLSGKDSLTTDSRLQQLLRAIPDSLKKRSRAADATRSGRYFSKPCEMVARAFESWVHASVRNDYLVNLRPVSEFKAPGRYPYALPEEMPAITEAFAELFCNVNL
jgi:hypothetical protein